MFTRFFFLLREKGVPCTITEWLSFLEALNGGFLQTSLNHLYYVGRAFLVKNEAYYDMFDEAFREYFGGIEEIPIDLDRVLEWLADPCHLPPLTEEEMREVMERLGHVKDLLELEKEFLKRLKDQRERHDGGSRWVGTGGTSPFGAYGLHPFGIRVGGESWAQSAVKVAEERRFRNYRNDLILDTRHIKVALKRLRELKREGAMEELDLDETIDKTAREGGEIELVFKRSRENTTRLLLFMDVGGSMVPYAHLCERLFSAASQMEHFKEFRHFYFHNCIYQDLYDDMANVKRIPTDWILSNFDERYKVIIVGDARMAPSELFEPYGAIDYFYRNEVPGIEWLRRLKERFPSSLWLNPTPKLYWSHPTVEAIGSIFPMFELTLDGLNESIRCLLSKGRRKNFT
jgi:uncharacterized protein with von Willebrand factor type A (vWA) domain